MHSLHLFCLMNKNNVENQPEMSDAELLADRVASKIVNVPNIIYAVGVANIGCLLFGYEVGAGNMTILYRTSLLISYDYF